MVRKTTTTMPAKVSTLQAKKPRKPSATRARKTTASVLPFSFTDLVALLVEKEQAQK